MKRIFEENIFHYIGKGLQTKPLLITLIFSLSLIALSILLDFSDNPSVREYSSIAFIGMGGLSSIMGLSLIVGMKKEKPIRFPIYLFSSIIWIVIGIWAIYQGIIRTFFD